MSDSSVPPQSMAGDSTELDLVHNSPEQIIESRAEPRDKQLYFPNEIWDSIRRNASPFYTGLLLRECNIHPSTEQAHNTIWYDIFKDERWLDLVTGQHRNPGLLAPELRDNILENRRRVTLLLDRKQDQAQEARNLFYKSLRPYSEVGNGYEVDIGRVRLNVGVIRGNPYFKDLCSPLHYLFWTDVMRSIRLIKAHQIHTTHLEDTSLIEMRLTSKHKDETYQYLLTEETMYWCIARHAANLGS
jgi:hypothetical protein